MPLLPRLACLLLSLAALAGVVCEHILAHARFDPGAGVLEVAWAQVRFFTILTNLLVGMVYLGAAIGARWPRPGLLAALTLWIGAVGAIYHALLYRGFAPASFPWVSDHIVHTLIPLGTLMVWLAFAPKRGIPAKAALIWLAWPIGYATYGLIRGVFDGRFPYFFLDPGQVGVFGVAAYILGLGAVFALGGLALIGLSRLMPDRD